MPPRRRGAPRSEAVRSIPDTVPPEDRTLGWAVLRWTADHLLQPDGPDAGRPWRYTPEQVRIVLRWYAIDDAGRFVHRRGVLRRMKGWGKDPFLASLAAAELCGPCRFGGWGDDGMPLAIPHPAPWVQVAAVSKDQTRNTMTLFPGMFSPDAVAEYGIDLGKEIIYTRGGTGRIEAVTSSPRALEGGRPSLVIANETHHWLATNDGLAMAEAIRRNLGKSRDGAARVMEITNAHLPGEGSAAEATYEAWRQSGGHLPGLYYDSVEAPTVVGDDGKTPVPLADLSDEVIRAGLEAARGDSTWVDIDRIMGEIRDPVSTEVTSRRYYLNQVASGSRQWLPDGAWEACADPSRTIPDGARVVLGFDGSRNHDTTVLVVCTVEEKPHVDLVGVWERPPGDRDWRVPRLDVKETIRQACRRWDVVEIAWDEFLWLDTAEELEDEGISIGIFGQQIEHMGPATQRMYEAVVSRSMSHSGHPVLAAHVANVVPKTDSRGTRLTKDYRGSPRKIDAAVATAMALHRAAYRMQSTPNVWDLNELVAELRAEDAPEQPPFTAPRAPTVPTVTFHRF